MFVYIISTVVCSEEMEPVRAVRRRFTTDIYFFESGHEHCDNENRTYLVDEGRCVNNIELINGNKNLNNKCRYYYLIFMICIGCNLAISAAAVPQMPHRIFVYISDDETKEILLTFDEDEVEANAVITFRDPQQQNISLLSNCHVVNLEVYRGEQQKIKIRHNGFIITNQRTIEVSRSLLRYISHYNSQQLVDSNK